MQNLPVNRKARLLLAIGHKALGHLYIHQMQSILNADHLHLIRVNTRASVDRRPQSLLLALQNGRNLAKTQSAGSDAVCISGSQIDVVKQRPGDKIRASNSRGVVMRSLCQ